MKVLIIDDSRLARRELRHLLKDHPELELAEAVDGFEAKQKIEELDPELIFLDIQMPGKSGFELLEELEEVPEVIFTTAYDQYAIKAFDYNAMDYLQKPVSEERLAKALGKVFDKIKSKTESNTSVKKLNGESQIFVKDGEQCWFVKLADIRLFEVDGNYTKVLFEGNQPMIPKTLNYLEERLDPEEFFRANRSQIVNLKWIDKIDPWFSGSIKITLKGGGEIETSRRQAIRFREMMSL